MSAVRWTLVPVEDVVLLAGHYIQLFLLQDTLCRWLQVDMEDAVSVGRIAATDVLFAAFGFANSTAKSRMFATPTALISYPSRLTTNFIFKLISLSLRS